jgi:hypothetical protein
MDVPVRYKRRQRLQPTGRPSVLGDGLLERARATSLALLGLTAAVGLTIVALALNQGWPLVEGSPVTRIASRHQGIAEATVASDTRSGGSRLDRRDASPMPRESDGGSGAVPAPEAPQAPTEVVVSHSAPAKPADDRSSGSPPPGPPAPGRPDEAPSVPAATHPAAQTPPPPPPPVDTVETEPPAATVSEAPAESNVPPWSNGRGHAYGRGDDHGHGKDK